MLELNSAGHRPSRTKVANPCCMAYALKIKLLLNHNWIKLATELFLTTLTTFHVHFWLFFCVFGSITLVSQSGAAVEPAILEHWHHPNNNRSTHAAHAALQRRSVHLLRVHQRGKNLRSKWAFMANSPPVHDVFFPKDFLYSPVLLPSSLSLSLDKTKITFNHWEVFKNQNVKHFIMHFNYGKH